MPVIDTVNAAFESLFYGEGSWLGFLIFISIFLGLVLRYKYSAAIVFPITLFLGLEYLDHNLNWQGFLMWGMGIFVIIYLTYNWRRG